MKTGVLKLVQKRTIIRGTANMASFAYICSFLGVLLEASFWVFPPSHGPTLAFFETLSDKLFILKIIRTFPQGSPSE